MHGWFKARRILEHGIDKHGPAFAEEGDGIFIITFPKDVFFPAAGHLLHCMVPCNHPAPGVDDKRGIGQEVDDIGHLLAGSFQLVTDPATFDGPVECVFKFRDHPFDVGAFLDIEISPVVQGLHNYFFPAFAGKEDERQVAVTVPDLFQELDPVHARHLVVGEDRIGTARMPSGPVPGYLRWPRLRQSPRSSQGISY